MRNVSALLLGGTLVATARAQAITVAPTQGTNLWDITRLTAPTLPAGQTGYWNDMDDFNFTKRVGLAWYFDRICPCQWGCDGRFCTWCANDRRLPAWYGKSKNGKSSADFEEDLIGVAPEHNMGPLYDCTDNLDTGVIINSTLVDIDRHNIQVQETHEFVSDEWRPEDHHAVAQAATTTAQTWTVDEFSIRYVPTIVEADNSLSINWYRWNDTDRGQLHSIPIIPRGIRFWDHQLIFWSQVFNVEKYNVYYNTHRLRVMKHNLSLPAGVSGMAYYQVYTQRIAGHAILDLMMRGRHAPRDLAEREVGEWTNLIHWKMVIPRVNYAVWIKSDDNDGWNYYYPRVNELLCGGATNPAMCRTHDQLKGRMVNRARTSWAGNLAPYVNRTVYDWDMSLGENWDERHNRRVLSVDQLKFIGETGGIVEISYEKPVNPTEYTGDYGIQYNVENPQLSYKLN